MADGKAKTVPGDGANVRKGMQFLEVKIHRGSNPHPLTVVISSLSRNAAALTH